MRSPILSFAALITILAQVPAHAQTPQPLRLASTPWSPFTNNPGQTRFASDLVDEALKRIGITADTTIVADGALTPALRDGRFNGSAAMWKDPERDQFLIFSDAYLENRLILVGRRGTDVSAKSLAQLAGKRIAILEGYAYGDAVRTTGGPIFVTLKTAEDTLASLLSGAVDYTLADELVVEYLIENHADEVRNRLALGTAPMLVRPLHFAIRRDLPNAQSIIDLFNGVLRTMVADRSYHRLLHIQWIQADIDGDGRTEFVPDADEVAAKPPDRGYQLFTNQSGQQEPTVAPRRFYVGGSIYEEWMMVPDAYKVRPAGAPAPLGANTASIFTFKW